MHRTQACLIVLFVMLNGGCDNEGAAGNMQVPVTTQVATLYSTPKTDYESEQTYKVVIVEGAVFLIYCGIRDPEPFGPFVQKRPGSYYFVQPGRGDQHFDVSENGSWIYWDNEIQMRGKRVDVSELYKIPSSPVRIPEF